MNKHIGGILFAFYACFAQSEELEIETATSGLLNLRIIEEDHEETELVTDRVLSSMQPSHEKAVARLNLEARTGSFTMNSQVRFIYEDQEGHDVEFDEMYGEYSISDDLFLFAGRRNIVFGQSYGINPVDIFSDYNRIDNMLNENRKRVEYLGQDMIGFESYHSRNATLTGYLAQDESTDHMDKGLFAHTTSFPDSNSDLTLLAFKDDQSGLGLSYTKTLTDSALLYLDTVFRQGRDRSEVV